MKYPTLKKKPPIAEPATIDTPRVSGAKNDPASDPAIAPALAAAATLTSSAAKHFVTARYEWWQTGRDLRAES